MSICSWAIAEFHLSLIWQESKNSVLWKYCQKLLPLDTHELSMVSLCFICQKNSRGVWITWLKGYFIETTYEDARAWQSWGMNLRTPCIFGPPCIHFGRHEASCLGHGGHPLPPPRSQRGAGSRGTWAAPAIPSWIALGRQLKSRNHEQQGHSQSLT